MSQGNGAKDYLASNKSNERAFIDDLRASKTSYDAFRVLKNVTVHFGYLKFIVMHLPDSRESKLADVAIVTNWDPELIKAYDANDLLADSPITRHFGVSTFPLSWDVSTASKERTADRQSLVSSLFSDFGMERGLYVCVSDHNGKRGLLGLAGNREGPTSEEIKTLLYVASYAYEVLTGLDEMIHPSRPNLSDREIECLYWTASGKTSSEVAGILDLSENTVNHYLSSAAHKLDTVNKAHTVAKALRLGILR